MPLSDGFHRERRSAKTAFGFIVTICVLAGVVSALADQRLDDSRPATQAAQAPRSVTFHKDVMPILQRDCQSCHRPRQIGPMPLMNYQQVRPWARSIKAKVAARQMPPWLADPRYGHFLNDRSLKQIDIDTLVEWADNGALEGNPSDAPPLAKFPDQGWLIEPDVTVDLPDYDLPVTGVIEWESLAVPSPFKEDTWVTSIEILQSEPGVVHHMCFDIVPHRATTQYNQYEWSEIERDDSGAAVRAPQSGLPSNAGANGATPAVAAPPGSPGPRGAVVVTRKVGAARDDVQRRTGRPSISAGANTFCWEHGLPAVDYRPSGAGRLVPGGADIIVTSHYTTNGKTPVTNRPKIGFTVAKERLKRKFVAFTLLGSPIAIPPNEQNWKAPTLSTTFRQDVELTWFWPHAHARGKDFTFTLEYPDGKKEIVLYVPRYDYNWELQYLTKIAVPKGTKMVVEAHYDNSSANRNNPNPNTWVYEGTQKWEEMMAAIFGVVVDAEVKDNEIISSGRLGSAGG